jgi:negative regulator of flagellin synthesis FlgM
MALSSLGPAFDETRISEIPMKIPPTTPGVQSNQSPATVDAGRTKTSGSTSTSPVPGSDSVKLSSLSTHLQSIGASVSGPEFDRAKVDKIKQAIADGSLTIDSSVVADKILASVHEILSKGGK